VHLTDWPRADASKIDALLSDETRLVMRVASLGRAARAKAQLRVRQPVAELFVKLPTQMEEHALERLAPQVLDELNVKAIRVVRDETDFLRFEVKPNLKLLGQKYGREVQDIARALSSMPDAELAQVARAAGAGETVEVTLTPAEGFGDHNPALTFTDDLENVPPDLRYPGARLEAQNANGEILNFIVTQIGNGKLTVDANHPLAGQTVRFRVTVVDVRTATADELRSGQAGAQHTLQ